MFHVSVYSCVCLIHWSRVLSRESRCSWTGAALTTSEWSTILLLIQKCKVIKCNNVYLLSWYSILIFWWCIHLIIKLCGYVNPSGVLFIKKQHMKYWHLLSSHNTGMMQVPIYSLRRRLLIGIGIPIIDLRWWSHHLRFIMWISVPVKRRLFSE